MQLKTAHVSTHRKNTLIFKYVYMKQMLLIFFALLCFSCKSAKSSSEEKDVQHIDINSRYFGNISSLLYHSNDSACFTFDSCLLSYDNHVKDIAPSEKPTIKIFGGKYSSEKHNTLIHNSNTIDSLSTFSQNNSTSKCANHSSFNKSLLNGNLCIVVCCLVVVLCVCRILKRWAR